MGYDKRNQRGYAQTHLYLGNSFCEYGTEIQYCPIHLPQFVFLKQKSLLLIKSRVVTYEMVHS